VPSRRLSRKVTPLDQDVSASEAACRLHPAISVIADRGDRAVAFAAGDIKGIGAIGRDLRCGNQSRPRPCVQIVLSVHSVVTAISPVHGPTSAQHALHLSTRVDAMSLSGPPEQRPTRLISVDQPHFDEFIESLDGYFRPIHETGRRRRSWSHACDPGSFHAHPARLCKICYTLAEPRVSQPFGQP